MTYEPSSGSTSRSTGSRGRRGWWIVEALAVVLLCMSVPVDWIRDLAFRRGYDRFGRVLDRVATRLAKPYALYEFRQRRTYQTR